MAPQAGRTYLCALPSAHAQAAGEGPCPTCSLEFEEILVLDSGPAPASPAEDAEILALSDGGFGVVSGLVGVSILLYNEDGSFRAEVGRRGDGPGEFSFPPVLGVAGREEFVVHDARSARLSRISNDGSFVAAERLEVTSTQLVGSDGKLVVAGIRVVDGVPLGLHFYDESTEEIRSVAELGAFDGVPNWLRMSASPSGDVWAIPIQGGPPSRFSDSGDLMTRHSLDLGTPNPESRAPLNPMDTLRLSAP